LTVVILAEGTNHRVELSLYYCRRSVDQFVLVSGLPLGPITRFIFLFFFFF
jgi:hypothetical protein